MCKVLVIILSKISNVALKLLNGRILFWGFVTLVAALYLVLPCRDLGASKPAPQALRKTLQSNAAAENDEAAAVLCEVYKSPWNKSCDFTLNDVHNKNKILLYGKYLSQEVIEGLRSCEYVYINSDFTIPDESSNFYAFDMQRYIKAKGIDFVTYPQNKDITFLEQGVFAEASHSVMYYSSRIRQVIEESLRKNMSEDTANVSMSIMTGDTADMSEEDKNAFRMSGMSHLMAVSGAHVAFVTKPISALLQQIKIRKNGLIKRKLILLPFIFAITFVSGFSASMVRAALMGSYGIFATTLKKRSDSINSLGFAGIITLLINPFYIYDAGFILSYLACLSIYLIMPKFKSIVQKSEINNSVKPIKATVESFFMGLSVNLGMLPIIVNMFNGISLIGIILNVFASPIAEFICTVGYVVTIFELVGLPHVFCEVVSYPIEFMSMILKMTAGGGKIGGSVDGSILSNLLGYRNYPSISISVVIVYYAVLFFIFVCNEKNRKKFAVFSIIVLTPALFILSPAKTEFVFFDVGQGVSVLVKTRDGSHGLIDTGDGKTDVSSLLFKEGVGKLDFVVLSHGHNDHYGGLQKIMEEHRIDIIFVPNNDNDKWITSFIEEYPQQKIIKVEENFKADVGKYLELNMYCFNDNENLNNASVVTFISGDWGSALMPGDIEKKTEYELAKILGNGNGTCESEVDLLCAAHHGSNTSSTKVFLETVSPEYAIISVGENNLYGHPASEVVTRLKNYTKQDNVFRTDHCGALRVQFDKFSNKLYCKIFDNSGDDRIVWRQKRKKASA